MPMDAESSQLHRVHNLFFILRERAKNGGSLLTYGETAKMVGTDNTQFSFGKYSDIQILAAWVKSRGNLPPLWILLRNKRDMLPGRGSTSVTLDKLGEAHAHVAVHPWDSVTPPTIDELASARDSLRAKPSSSN